jgi:hypothetical protein
MQLPLFPSMLNFALGILQKCSSEAEDDPNSNQILSGTDPGVEQSNVDRIERIIQQSVAVGDGRTLLAFILVSLSKCSMLFSEATVPLCRYCQVHETESVQTNTLPLVLWHDHLVLEWHVQLHEWLVEYCLKMESDITKENLLSTSSIDPTRIINDFREQWLMLSAEPPV